MYDNGRKPLRIFNNGQPDFNKQMNYEKNFYNEVFYADSFFNSYLFPTALCEFSTMIFQSSINLRIKQKFLPT